MSSAKLKAFLNSQNVKYEIIGHSPAYTAQETAATVHVKGREMAKTVIVKLDGKMTMAVLPASHLVDFEKLKAATGARVATLTPEPEFKDLFPDCEVGSMPPFGNLYGMDVLVSRALEEDEEIVFNACSFSELIRLSFEDFKRLVGPKIIDISIQQDYRTAA